jgi:hypothetical protein
MTADEGLDRGRAAVASSQVQGVSRDAAHVARAIASAAARLDVTRLGIAAIWHGLMKFLRLWRMTRTNQ